MTVLAWIMLALVPVTYFMLFTKRGGYYRFLIKRKFMAFRHRTKNRYMFWKIDTLPAWIKKNKDSWYLKFLENASWFKWYGKNIVYVKPKDPSKLSATEVGVKEAINSKDYKRALEIVNGLPVSRKTMALKQLIEGKLR
jgi:hypothetical protein